jgi:hypothetical protein
MSRADDRTALKWILKEIECKDVNWINLVQDRDQRRGLKHGDKNVGFMKTGKCRV